MRLLLIFLLLIPELIQQPKPNTASAKTSIRKGDSEKKTNNENAVSADGVSGNCATVQQPTAKPEQANSYDAGHDTLYRAYLWFTIIGVPLALIGICVLYSQGRVIKNAERAWIIAVPTEWSPDLFSNSPHQPQWENAFKVKLINIGRTPARVIYSSVRYVLIESLESLPKEPDYGTPDPAEDLIIAPHEVEEPEAALVSRAVLETPNGLLSLEDDAALAEQTKILYAFGVIRYRDVHGTQRETRFGYHYVQRKPEDTMRSAFRQAGPAGYRRTT